MNKTFNKYFLVTILSSFLLFLIVVPAQAETGMPALTIPDLQIDIPGMDKFSDSYVCGEKKDKLCIDWLNVYIAGLFRYGIGIVGILATIVMMWGGVIWLTSAGNSSKIGEAKTWITSALTGLVIALSSYMILYQINPNLVWLKGLEVPLITPKDIVLNEDTISETTTDGIKTKGEKCFYDSFGADKSSVQSQLVSINCSTLGSITVHRLAKNAFAAACSKIPPDAKTTCGSKLKNSGTYNWREIDGSSKRSLHSWGIAIDLNSYDCGVEDNIDRGKCPSGKNCGSNLPQSVVNAFTSTDGFRWGGDYRSKTDNMHFEWLGNCMAN